MPDSKNSITQSDGCIKIDIRRTPSEIRGRFVLASSDVKDTPGSTGGKKGFSKAKMGELKASPRDIEKN